MKTFILSLLFLAFLASVVVLRVEASKAASAHEPAAAPVIATAPLPGHAGKVLERACRDCHSNQTSWPWYSHVPPASWMIQRDVDLGRRMFDFTDWASGRATPTKDQLSLICIAVSAGSMPPLPYRQLHSQAKLTADDIDALCKLGDSAGAH
jgi:hypothetical protein